MNLEQSFRKGEPLGGLDAVFAGCYWVGVVEVMLPIALRDFVPELVEALSEGFEQGIAVCDASGKLIYLNNQGVKLLGAPLKTTRFETWPEDYHLYLPDKVTAFLPEDLPLVRALRGQEVREIEVFVSNPDLGEHGVFLFVSARPLRREGGEILGAVAVFRDATGIVHQREALRLSEERFRLGFEASAFATAVVDTRLRFSEVNPAYATLMGYSTAELAGKSIFEVTHPEDVAKFREAVLVAAKTLQTAQLEKRNLRKDGGLIWVRVTYSPVKGERGEFLYFLSLVEDVTHKRQAEAELRRSNSELQQFAYVASHDLKEPLRMVGNFVRLLQQKYHGVLDKEAEEFIEHASQGVTRMHDLIEGLLSYSRVGTSEGKKTKFDLRQIAQQIVADLSILLEEAGATVQILEIPQVYGHELLLRQLLQNLVMNAIKFRSPERPLEVTISGVVATGTVLLKVQDNGIGIDPTYSERVFRLFQRLHTRDEIPGSGIGLAICKKIAESEGGRIWFESVPGAPGTQFFVSLPQGNS